MLPEFDDNGYLPPGVYHATLEEIAERFGQESEIRQAEMESLGWLVDWARRAGIKRLIINGSFVTDAMEPNDVDCVVLIEPGFRLETSLREELEEGLPFLEIQLVEQEDFNWIVEVLFATDRDRAPKGVVEVIL